MLYMTCQISSGSDYLVQAHQIGDFEVDLSAWLWKCWNSGIDVSRQGLAHAEDGVSRQGVLRMRRRSPEEQPICL